MFPFLDLAGLNRRDESALTEAFQRVLRSGWYVLGAEVSAFESEYANACGVRHAVGVGNGLDALTLMLRGYLQLGRLEEGDEVILPDNSFIATALAVSEAGLVPILVEPDANTFNIDPIAVESAIGPRTRAIIAVHLYGCLADMGRLRSLADQHGLLLLEDAAQAHGARDEDGSVAGALGDAAGFSFFPVKNLGALGDAGALTTQDDALAEQVRKLRNYGSSRKYIHEVQGVNSRLDELQAALLRVKLVRMDQDAQARRYLARRYLEGIDNPLLRLPQMPAVTASHVWHQFVVRSQQRAALQDHLERNGVPSLIHYPVPIHLQQAYRQYAGLDLPVSTRLADEVLSLPMYPGMPDGWVEKTIEACNSFRG
ncbi:DegT/DnrJ/EryC1/StrS family aminotransferase [Pseudomonas mangrovi]|uniref:Aminotransferase n=1 Tax=Pseudomonas mangrovi TaxID=2161748 RepID=A0A2T5P6B3_9PSED|nr:DegT/DnrJ/EryC1/StrS family aminotransferase [Pseudomonas mangrovi]PTU73266.1 aminotransferase [Pseudomonas mangrovi]